MATLFTLVMILLFPEVWETMFLLLHQQPAVQFITMPMVLLMPFAITPYLKATMLKALEPVML